MSYDNRKPGDGNIMAWQESSVRGRWTFEEAREAVFEHFANSTEYLRPAHVTQHIRAQRQLPLPAKLIEAPPKPAAQPEHVRNVLAALGKRLGWTQQQTTHDPAMSVTCPHCRAVAGRPCARQLGRGHRRGQWVPIKAFHPSRIELAAQEGA